LVSLDRETWAVSGKQRDVLTVFLFDERESEQVEDWQGALKSLADDELLWLALRDPTEVEVAALREALELGGENAQRLLEQPGRAAGGRGRAHARDAVRGRHRRG